MGKDEVDIKDLFQNLKGTWVYNLLDKNLKIAKRYAWILILMAVLFPIGWHLYKSQKPPQFETLFLLKNDQLNHALAEQIAEKLNQEFNTDSTFTEGQSITFAKEQDNYDLIQKLDLYERIITSSARNWVKFQEMIRIRVVSSQPLKPNFSKTLAQFIDNQPYLSSLKEKNMNYVKEKLNLINSEIASLQSSENKALLVDLNLKRIDLEFALTDIPSTKVLYQSKSQELPTYRNHELFLASIAGIFIMMIILNFTFNYKSS